MRVKLLITAAVLALPLAPSPVSAFDPNQQTIERMRREEREEEDETAHKEEMARIQRHIDEIEMENRKMWERERKRNDDALFGGSSSQCVLCAEPED